MPRKCVVLKCQAPKTCLFSLPKDVYVRRRWLNFLAMEEENVNSSSKVCAAHFSQESFENLCAFEMGFVKGLVLKPEAVPNIYADGSSAVNTGNTRDVGCQCERVLMKSCGVQVFDLPKTRDKSTQACPEKRSVAVICPTKRMGVPLEPTDSSSSIKRGRSESSLSDGPADSGINFDPDETYLNLDRNPPSLMRNKYTVDEDCLLELFNDCPMCSRRCSATTTVAGSLITVHQTCSHCQYHRVWKSQPYIGGIADDNLHSSDANDVSGASFSQNDNGELEVTLSSDDADYESLEEENMEEDSSDEWEMPTDDSSLDEEEADGFSFQEEANSLPVVGCKDCGSEFMPQCSLVRHEKVFGCPRCGAGDGVVSHCFEKLVVLFNDFTSFQYHAKKEHGTIPKRMLCPDCGVFFVIPTETNGKKEHVCDHKVKAFVCAECNKRFSTEQGLKTHTRTVHGSSVHPCKYCLKPFWNRPSKLEHEQNHPKEDEPYSCSDCPKKFSNIYERNRHLRTHRGLYKHVCKTCGMGFSKMNLFRRHELIHSGDKPFKCEVCERSFNQPGHLKSHLRIHTGEKPYKCKVCEKCFNHNISLKSHVQRYHRSEAPPGGTQLDSESAKSHKKVGRPRRALVDNEHNVENSEKHVTNSETNVENSEINVEHNEIQVENPELSLQLSEEHLA